MTPPDLPEDEVDLAQLRRRRSVKWTRHPPDVLPLWVAETDFALAEPVTAALHGMVERSDTGYATAGALPEEWAALASRRWGVAVDPSRALVLSDVISAVMRALEAFTDPGDAVVVETPAYPPFWWAVRATGRRVVEVPYAADGDRWRPDLDGVATALVAGARAVLLCSPHNPTGTVHDRAHLEALADLAERHGAAVVADEVHALLTYPDGPPFVPFAAVAADRPALVSATATSASKAWGLAGLKCALLVADGAAAWERLRTTPEEHGYATGLLGVAATEAAFRDGEPWLDATLARLTRSRDLLARLLADRLPRVRWTPPAATYLAWLDWRAYGLGDDPAAVLLDRARVALSPGPDFGAPGAGWARLNLGTGPAVLREAVDRLAAAVA